MKIFQTCADVCMNMDQPIQSCSSSSLCCLPSISVNTLLLPVTQPLASRVLLRELPSTSFPSTEPETEITASYNNSLEVMPSQQPYKLRFRQRDFRAQLRLYVSSNIILDNHSIQISFLFWHQSAGVNFYGLFRHLK